MDALRFQLHDSVNYWRDFNSDIIKADASAMEQLQTLLQVGCRARNAQRNHA
jgi:hypothetical protein